MAVKIDNDSKTKKKPRKQRQIKRIDVVKNESGEIIAKKRKVPSKPPTSQKQLNAIFDEVYKLNPTLYYLFHMSSLTGLRFSDASWLMIEDFYDARTKTFVDDFPVVQQKTYNMAVSRMSNKIIREKGQDALTEQKLADIQSTAASNSTVNVYVNAEMKELVTDIMERRNTTKGFLFPNEHHNSDGLPMSTNGANDVLKKVADKLGIKFSLRTHSFRKFASNTLSKKGASSEQVRDFLGQKSLGATTLYLSTEEDEIRSLANQLSYS